MALRLNMSQQSLSPGWRSPTMGTAPAASGDDRTRKLELRILCLEEQLHKLGDEIHPEVGDLMLEVSKLKAENESLQESLRREADASSNKDLAVAKLKNAFIERDARILTLQEEEGRTKKAHTDVVETLKAALIEKTNKMLEAKQETKDAAAKLAELEDSIGKMKKTHREEIEALHSRMATAIQEENVCQTAQLTEELQRLTDANAHLQRAADEASAVALEGGDEAVLKIRRLEKTCRELSQQKQQLEDEILEKELLQQRKQEIDVSMTTVASNRELELKLNENDEKWLAVIATIRQEIQKCEAETRLITSRDARKADLLQEYHVALTLIEDERDQLAEKLIQLQQQSEECEEVESVRSFM